MPKNNFVNKAGKNIDVSIDAIVDRLTSEEGRKLFPDLNVPQERLKLIRGQLKNEFLLFKDYFIKGYHLVMENALKGRFGMPAEQFELGPIEWRRHPDWENLSEEQLLSLINRTIFLQEICDYSPKMMRGIYELSCDCLHSKDFDNAIALCIFLSTLNPTVFGFWQVLGKAFEGKGNFPQALVAFEIGINCQMDKIDGYKDAVRCCLEAKELDDALRIVDFGLKITQKNPQLKELKKELDSMKVLINSKKRG